MINHHLEKQLGFDWVRNQIISLCESEEGKYLANEFTFSTNFSTIEKNLIETLEFTHLRRESSLPTFHINDFSKYLNFCKIDGAVLTGSELYEIFQSLQVYYDLKRLFFGKGRANYPLISKLVNSCRIESQLYDTMYGSLEKDGELSDAASPELIRIRKQINSKREATRSKVAHVLKQFKKEGHCSEDALATIYNGRLVLPINANVKRVLSGLIHGESSGGAIVYFEPESIVEDNNQCKSLLFEEKREEQRILADLTNLIKENHDELFELIDVLAYCDFTNAKSKFSGKINSIKPVLLRTASFKVKNARHPQLLDKLETVVPISLSLTDEQRWIIVSGPNAGGKSIALKTIGIIQYMLQSGLLIPAEEGTEMGVFDNVYVDIGDSQSIDDALSTYSGHLSFMKNVIDNGTNNSLVLIDELGSGTAPDMGGKIGETLVSEIIAKGGKGLITSHFPEIKSLATQHDFIANACMLYDPKELKPLYELEVGRPGNSYALDLMRKTAFSSKIIKKVRKIIPDNVLEQEQLSKDLEKQITFFRKENERLSKTRKNLSEEKNTYQELKEHQQIQEKELIRKAKIQAKEIYQKAEQEAKQLIKAIKKQATKESSSQQAILQKIQKKKNDVQFDEENKSKGVRKLQSVEVGDRVKVSKTGFKAEVVEQKGNKILLEKGMLKQWVSLEELEGFEGNTQKLQAVEKSKQASTDLLRSKAEFSNRLDIRGTRALEAHDLVMKYIDKAILADVISIDIVHGKGDGILRNVVRSVLKEIPQVIRYENEHADRGGDGVTVAYLE